MSEWVRICSEKELPAVNRAREFEAANRTICVANVDGVVCAVDNVCPHHGGPLADGIVEDGKIVCPWHGWNFNSVTGKATHLPHAKVEVFRLSRRDGDVFVEVQSD